MSQYRAVRALRTTVVAGAAALCLGGLSACSAAPESGTVTISYWGTDGATDEPASMHFTISVAGAGVVSEGIVERDSSVGLSEIPFGSLTIDIAEACQVQSELFDALNPSATLTVEGDQCTFGD
ncbi:hypothetical protein [Leucobacter japonicus]|uniref:hypothetical protein n=1 Tax=Leucobacter japonicus TaxID=1461259 RepID=UPI0006A7F072|nr:hypothetical protein [Leucobacter japonicus]